jgi:hypothetical protein
MMSLKDGYNNQQPGQLNRVKGVTDTSRLAVPTTLVSRSPPRIVGVTWDSVHPSAQDP